MNLEDYRKLVKVWDCKWCGTSLIHCEIDCYDHQYGWEVNGYTEKQWLSIHCPKCEYDWSLNKLGVSR